jgi:hypothetical protein
MVVPVPSKSTSPFFADFSNVYWIKNRQIWKVKLHQTQIFHAKFENFFAQKVTKIWDVVFMCIFKLKFISDYSYKILFLNNQCDDNHKLELI